MRVDSAPASVPAGPPGRAPAAPGVRIWIPHRRSVVRRDPLNFMTDCRRRLGDVFRMGIGPLTFHVVAHPDHVRHVLQDNYRNYPRSRLYRRTREVIGDGMVSQDGPPWQRQRRLAQPAFHPRRVAALAGTMVDAAQAMLRRWEAAGHGGEEGGGEPFDIAAEMMRLTLGIAGRTLFGVDIGEEAAGIGAAVTHLLHYLEYRITNPLTVPLAVPTPWNRRYRQALATLNGFIHGVIADRRRAIRDFNELSRAAAGPDGNRAGDHPQARHDLLSVLLLARDDEMDPAGGPSDNGASGGIPVDDKFVRDQVITFLVAGHETTAISLAWTWYLLCEHPAVDARVREEVAAVVGGRVPTAEDVPRLAYTRQVIEESLRLYPPVYAFGRDAVEADVIGGYRIPAGSAVMLSPWVTHRHADVWPDPDAFDPGRFDPSRSAGRHKFAWFPFAGGPHQCIGGDFAMMEMALVVATVVQRYRLRRVPGPPVVPEAVLSTRPKGGVWVVGERMKAEG